jgi:UDP-glucose 4-epimerase
MSKILVTGGCGYIGSHTIVELQQAGFEVVSIDDNSCSEPWVMDRVQNITGISCTNHQINLCDIPALRAFFAAHTDISGVIHFAAFKSVGESSTNPLKYFYNNLLGQINLMQCVQDFKIPHLVFSSSCTVYGNPEQLPVTEESPMQEPESPYGRTKVIGEAMLRDLVKVAPVQVIALRYFNPVGAHPTNEMGEYILGVPSYLLPYITQTAIGKREKLTVFGGDYPTRDGTCIRDYIHVCDIARAHVNAIQYLQRGAAQAAFEVFNLGSGLGQTVLEMIASFEKVTGLKLNYQVGDRRGGDVVAVYANNRKAREVLGWELQFDLDAMMATSWAWEQRLAREQAAH